MQIFSIKYLQSAYRQISKVPSLMTKLGLYQEMVHYICNNKYNHIDGLKEKNHNITSVDVDKAFDKVQHTLINILKRE